MPDGSIIAGDVSRESEPVREAYAAGLRAYLDAFARSMSGKRGEVARRRALRQFAQMVGALTLARSVARADPTLSDEILDAARAQASAIANTESPIIGLFSMRRSAVAEETRLVA